MLLTVSHIKRLIHRRSPLFRAWTHSPHLQFEMLLTACMLLLTCPCAFDCFSPSTSLCPLLAVDLSFIFSLQGAFSKVLKTNCSNGNTNTVCSCSTPIPLLGPYLFSLWGLIPTNHHPSIHNVWCDSSCSTRLCILRYTAILVCADSALHGQQCTVLL